MGDRIYVPLETFTTDLRTFIKDTTRVREGHPILTQFPHMFRVAPAHYEWPEVEQATAGPGEHRGEKRDKAVV